MPPSTEVVMASGNPPPLSVNGIVVPEDFPVGAFEAIHARIVQTVESQSSLYAEYSGALNGIAYRYLAMTQYSDEFTASITKAGGGHTSEDRYRQERALFGFFTSGLSALESTFYLMFSVGAFLSPAAFPMTTRREQQAVTPSSTLAAYRKTFPADALLNAFKSVLEDQAYLELRHIRNVLAHRAAPGRQIYLAVGDSEPLPDEWKLLNIPLDGQTTPKRRAEVAILLKALLEGASVFVAAKF
jgi:hypothetical protein